MDQGKGSECGSADASTTLISYINNSLDMEI